MIDQPFENGGNGRKPNGQFGIGNPGGPGNPVAKRAVSLKETWNRALEETVTLDELKLAISACISKAKAGDIGALKELADRLVGKPITPVELETRVHREPIISTENFNKLIRAEIAANSKNADS